VGNCNTKGIGHDVVYQSIVCGANARRFHSRLICGYDSIRRLALGVSSYVRRVFQSVVRSHPIWFSQDTNGLTSGGFFTAFLNLPEIALGWSFYIG